jgi:DnaD/phage-associated family protein
MSKLLLDESPIIVLPSLAQKVGLNEAIIIQQIHYWIQKSKHVHEERLWIFNTYDDWKEQFPFWSISTIRRSIAKLEKLGFLFIGNFNRSPIDQTKWYSINYELLEGLNRPTAQNEQMGNGAVVQSEQTTVQNEQSSCSEWAVQLFNMNRPIPEITTEITTEKKEEEEAPAYVENPFQFFEQNGFGTIGGHISQKISAWCDDLSDELVLEAMKIAVERGAKSWSYVEKILINWDEKKIKTVQEAHALILAYKEQQSKQRDRPGKGYKPKRTEMLPDWFDEQENKPKEAAKENQPDLSKKKQTFQETLRKLREGKEK